MEMPGPGAGDRLRAKADSLTSSGHRLQLVPARQHPPRLGTCASSRGRDPALVTAQCLLKMGFPCRSWCSQRQEAGSEGQLVHPR